MRTVRMRSSLSLRLAASWICLMQKSVVPKPKAIIPSFRGRFGVSELGVKCIMSEKPDIYMYIFIELMSIYLEFMYIYM